MKKLVLALSAVAVFSGSALAADLPARTYTKAPVVVETPSWTGFYIFGGGGGGVWDADNHTSTAVGPISNNVRTGGDGWFGTVGAGYDWQFNGAWVAGIFADGTFGSLTGSVNDPFNNVTGNVKLQDAWAAAHGWAIWSLRMSCPTSTVVTPRRIGRDRLSLGLWLAHFSRRHRRSIVAAGSSAAASKTT